MSVVTTKVLEDGIVVELIDVAVATPMSGVTKIGESGIPTVTVPAEALTEISFVVPITLRTPEFEITPVGSL
jgi:hypothetical protein